MNVGSLSEALVKASDRQTGPIQSGSAASRVYSGLRSRIISLELLPGTIVSRPDLAREYDVSQSPLREAIQQLEHEGLLASYPKSKTLVTRIDVEQARETQFMRLGIELELGRTLAQKKDSELLLASRRILRMQRMAGEDRDISEFTALDWLFHLSLFQAAGVPSLWHMISNRCGHIDRLRRLNLPDPGKISAVISAHEKILDAIAAGNLTETEAQIRKHLSGTLAQLPEIARLHPEYFGDNAAEGLE